MDKQLLLNPAQTAAMLGVRENTLASWRAKRRYGLKYVRIGGRIAYRSSDVEDFILSRTVSGTEAPSPSLNAKPHKAARPGTRGRRKLSTDSGPEEQDEREKPRRGSAPKGAR
jgi:hypothetical protein